jgi:hypothetical protein
MFSFAKISLLKIGIGLSFAGVLVTIALFLSQQSYKNQTPLAQAKTTQTEEQGKILGVDVTAKPTPANEDVEEETNTTTNIRRTSALVTLPTIFSPSPTTSSTNNDSSSNSSSSNTTTPTPTKTTSTSPTPTQVPESPPTNTILEIFTGSNITVTAPGSSPKKGVHGQKIVLGSTITTGAGTRAQLLYPTGGVTRLDEATSIVFKEEPGPTTGGSIAILAGRTWQRVKKVIGIDSYETETPSALAAVRGTSYGHSIEKDADGDPIDRVVTMEGKVAVKCKKTNTQEVIVRPNDDLELSCIPKKFNPALNQVAGMSDDEIEWVVLNLKLDELLKSRFKNVNFGDPENPEVILSENKPPVVDAGTDQTITFGQTAKLNGTATDDNLPFKSKPVTLWVALDVGAYIPLNNQQTLKTNVSFDHPGTYRFRLIASDLYQESKDEVIVTVLPKNTAPTIEFGSNFSVQAGTPTQIPVTVTDDGLPTNSTLSYEWSVRQASKAKFVKFDASVPNPTFTFYKADDYVIELKVSDGELFSKKMSISVEVTEPPSLSISSVVPHDCTAGSSCSGTTTLEVNGAGFNADSRVKVTHNSNEVVGNLSGGNQNTQLLADFQNLVVCQKYDVTVFFASPDPRTAKVTFTYDPQNTCNPTITTVGIHSMNCPGSNKNNCKVVLNVDGTNFVNGSKIEVTATSGNQSSKVDNSTTFFSSTSLRGNWAALPRNSTFNVRVFLPDGKESTLNNAFSTN